MSENGRDGVGHPNGHGPDCARCHDLSHKQILTPAEAAHLLGLSKTTVISWCERGILPSFRVDSRWYLKRSELLRDGWLPTADEQAAATGEG
jgi:excisionase family DNA binding protein